MPETSNAILEAKRRARDYWDIDGLPALLTGAAIVLWGVFLLRTEPAERHQPGWGGALVLGLWASVYFLLRSKRTLEWLKSRITYPRTGYVALPQADPGAERDPYPVEGRASRKALEFADFPFLLFLALWFAYIGWFVSLNGWLISLACLAAALSFWWRNKKDPPWFEIAGAAIAGLVSAVVAVNGERRIDIVILVFGASGMVKGATLLIRYLRQHRAPQA